MISTTVPYKFPVAGDPDLDMPDFPMAGFAMTVAGTGIAFVAAMRVATVASIMIAAMVDTAS